MGDQANGKARRILVGVVGAPHGVQGDLRVKSYMQEPAALGQHALFLAPAGGRSVRLGSIRALRQDMLVGRLTGIATREAAAALTGTPLYIDRATLDAPAEDEFYNADLIGLAVHTTSGDAVGRIADVVNYGGGDLLEIDIGESTVLVPFLKRFVPDVDIAAGRLTVTPAALWPEGDGPAAQPAP